MNHVLTAALAWQEAGYSVVRTATDGTKRPLGAWKQHQATPATRRTVEAWFTGGHPGLGVITGAVSGNLEMLELEGRIVAEGTMTALRELADASGLGDLLTRVLTGYCEFTPSGGFHLFYRCTGTIAGNTKLAQRPVPGPERVLTLMETRGEGGFVVLAPSHGPVHPTGAAWVAVPGTHPANIATVTEDERDALHALAMAFDEMPQPDPEPAAAPREPHTGGLRPGEDYNQRATWNDILGSRGWTISHHAAGVTYWCRPGKSLGVSATTGRNDGDNLFVFTTSSEFDAQKPYSKFSAIAHLEHGGDYKATAKALAAAGYGEPSRPAAIVHDDPANDEPDTGPYTRTDDGNALLLIDAHHETLRYCHDRGTWMQWDGHRWRWDSAEHTRERARTLARDLPGDGRAATRHRDYSLSARGVTNMLRLAQSDQRVTVSMADLDSRAYELNTPNGVINLRTGTLGPPDPAALHTRSTAIPVDLDATPTRWLEFLADTFAGDHDLTTYVQRLLGVSLIGGTLEQLLPFCYGAGANGKTTLLAVVQRILGIGDTGYSISAPSELLLDTRNAEHPTELARLAGARLVVTSELEEGRRFAEAKVKALTGGDPVTARFMRQDYFTFIPTHSLWLAGNHQPSVKAGGNAFWRRLRLLPFIHTVPEHKRIKGLDETLVEAEGSAILGWLVHGAHDYLQHGLDTPDTVTTATDTYATDQDTVARFIEDRCITGDPNRPDLRIPVADLRQAYEHWCRVEGEQPVNAKSLSTALRDRHNVYLNRTNSSRHYYGIRLDETLEDAADETPTERDGSNGWRE